MNEAVILSKWGMLSWQQKWNNLVQRMHNGHRATIWYISWMQDTCMLYAGLLKAEATALFLMRTEVIKLNA